MHHRISLVAAMCLLLTAGTPAQTPKPKPKPIPAEPAKPAAPAREPARQPAATATLLIVVDVAATISIDGKTVGQLDARETRQLPVGKGQHLVAAEAGEDRWETVVDVKEPTQLLVRVQLADVRRTRLDAARAADETARTAEAEKAKREEAARKARMTPEGAAHEMIAAVVERMGGLEKIRAINTVVMTATQSDPKFTTIYQRPNRFRTTIESHYADGTSMRLARGYDGSRGWQWNDRKGMQAGDLETADFDRRSVSQVFPILLETILNNGLTVRKLDASTIDVVQAEVTYRLLIGPAGLISGTEGSYTVDGKVYSTRGEMLDYREVDGLMLPFTMVSTDNDGKRTVIQVEYNTPVDPVTFLHR
jgi:hypothetical protein